MGSDVNEVLQQAMEFYVAGDTVAAKALLLDLVRAHPTLEAGWMFLSYTMDDPIQKADCLKQVLKINPQNSEAKGTLEQLNPTPKLTAQPPVPAPAHPSPFTVDISHATDEISEVNPLSAVTPAPKAVAAFQETPVVRESAPPVLVKPQDALTREAPPVMVKPQDALTREAPPVKGQPQEALTREPLAKQDLMPAPSKPVAVSPPIPAKSAAVPPATDESPKPKKRGNLGCTCFAITVIALLIVGGVGVGLWSAGYFPGLSSPFQPPATPTATPGPTDTPVVLTLPPRWTDTPPPTITFTPTISSTPTQTPTPTFAAPDATDQAVIDKLEKQVADLRGLQWEGSLPIYVVSQDQAETVLEAELDQSGYRATISNQTKVLVALGFIKPTYDLAKYALSRLSDGVLGFYVPSDIVIYVIGSGFGGMQHWTFVHEFDHALVHHFYPAVGMMDSSPICVNDSQRCDAIRALVEGDATLLMDQWYEQYATLSDRKDISLYRVPFGTPPEENSPPYIGPEVYFPYSFGANFVYALWQKGNWAEVNKAYDNLPLSTEQIIHPEKYFKGEKPVVMNVPDLMPDLGDQWTLVGSDSLGELMTHLLLSYGADNIAEIPDTEAVKASVGWGGDHYLVYASAAGDQTVLAAEWNWDTNKDADEFLASMKLYLDKRFRGEKTNNPTASCWSMNNQTTCVYHTARNTLWFLAPDMDTIKKVLSSYPTYS